MSRLLGAMLVAVVGVFFAPRAAVAAPCPIWLSSAAPTASGDVYAFGFTSLERGEANLRLTMFSGAHAYTASFASVRFDATVASRPGMAQLFDVAPLFVRLPAGGPALEGASLDIVDPTDHSSLACSGRYFWLPELERAPTHGRSELPIDEVERARAAAKGYGPDTDTVAASEIDASAPACAHPYVPARIAGQAAMLDYPQLARDQGQTGIAIVAVELDAAGKPISMNLFKATGFPLLDASARKSATQTTYASEIFRCAPVAGNYLFQASFLRS